LQIGISTTEDEQLIAVEVPAYQKGIEEVTNLR